MSATPENNSILQSNMYEDDFESEESSSCTSAFQWRKEQPGTPILLHRSSEIGGAKEAEESFHSESVEEVPLQDPMVNKHLEKSQPLSQHQGAPCSLAKTLFLTFFSCWVGDSPLSDIFSPNRLHAATDKTNALGSTLHPQETSTKTIL